MRKIAFLLVFVNCLTFCRKNNIENVPKTNDSISKIEIKKPIIQVFKTKTDELLFKLKEKEKEILSKIKSETPENNNLSYENFRKINEKLLAELNTEENQFLNEIYIGFYSEITNEIIIPEKYQQKINEFNKADLKIESVGEGFHELKQKPDYYYNIFKNKVTSDYNDFLKNEAFDNLELYTTDGGLAISLEKIAVRILNWETFLVKNPKSKLFKESRETYKYYIMNYLFGLENTPSFDYNTNTLIAENKSEFERFIKSNPNSVSTKIIKKFLENTINPIDSNKLYSIIDKEQQKYLKPTN